MITDTNGNQLAGARITAVVNAKALRGKDAQSFTVTTVANGHFAIPNVPVTNAVNGNGPLGTGSATGNVLTISIEAPTGYLGATALVNPQAQVVSSENGGLIQGGDTNPQVVWFDHFNADAGTIELPATIATITGILRNGNTGAGISAFPMRLTFEQVILDQFGQGNAPLTGVVVSYASGNEQRIQTESTGAGTIAGRFFFTNVAADSCVRIYAPGLNFVDKTGGTGQDFGGAVCADQGAGSVSYLDIATNDDFVQLNRIFATESETRDTIPPIVAAVVNATGLTGGCIGQASGSATFTVAQIDSDTITVIFSEPVQIDEDVLNGANPVVVLVGNPPNVTSATVDAVAAGADGRSLVITLAEPLPLASQVRVQLPVEAITDFSTPPNTLADAPGGIDALLQTVNNGSVENQVISLCFNVFSPNNTPGAINVLQSSDVVNAASLIFQSSHALADFVSTNAPDHGTFDENDNPVGIPAFAGIDQINGPDQNGEFGVPLVLSPDPSDELTALATALSGLGVPSPETTVINTTGVVHVTNGDGTQPFPAGTTVVIALQDPVNSRAKDVGFWTVNTGSGDPEVIGVICPFAAPCPNPKQLPLAISNGGQHWYVIDPNGATDFDVIIAGEDTNGAFSEDVSNGDLVHVIARDSNKVLISTDDIALLDNVVPSTALQLLGTANGVVSLSEFGEGGTVVIIGNTNTGVPVLPVTPQIADKIDPGTGCGAANGTAAGYSSDDYLDEQYVPSGLADQNIANAAGTDTFGNCRADTDATGMAVFFGATGASRNDVTAIAITEEFALTGVAAPAYTGNATLGALSVHNHTPTENFVPGPAGSGAVKDLVEFNVDNVFTLQADARDNANQTISLDGAIEDTTAGNEADETAQVVLRDKYPPLVVFAFFDGTNIVIAFNEPVALDGTVTFDTCAQTVALDYVSLVPTTEQISQNAAAVETFEAGSIVTIPAENFSEQTGAQPGTCFSNAPAFAYDEAVYSDLPAGLTDLNAIATPQRHGYISWRGVPDSQGNVWDCGVANVFCNGSDGANSVVFDWSTTQLGIGAPRFAMADILGPFQPILSQASPNFSTVLGTGALNGETINYNVEFSHPVFITAAGPGTTDEFGNDADANNDGTVTNAELLAFTRLKFEYFDDVDGAADPLQLTGVQVRDATGADILVNGDINDARRFFITFTINSAGGDVDANDRIRMVSGNGVTSLLDPLQDVRPFDEGPGGDPNSDPGQAVNDGDNNTNELQELQPYPAEGEAVCPQTEFSGPEPDQC